MIPRLCYISKTPRHIISSLVEYPLYGLERILLKARGKYSKHNVRKFRGISPFIYSTSLVFHPYSLRDFLSDFHSL